MAPSISTGFRSGLWLFLATVCKLITPKVDRFHPATPEEHRFYRCIEIQAVLTTFNWKCRKTIYCFFELWFRQFLSQEQYLKIIFKNYIKKQIKKCSFCRSISAITSNSWRPHHFAMPCKTCQWCRWWDAGVVKTWPEPPICPCETVQWRPTGWSKLVVQGKNISVPRRTETGRRVTETVQSETFWWGNIQMLCSKTEYRI